MCFGSSFSLQRTRQTSCRPLSECLHQSRSLSEVNRGSGAGQAISDIKTIIAEVQPPRVVIHCCTEKWEDVKPLVAAGHFLSFTGIATFPASAEIRRTIKMCPVEQLMIETDSPYLAPIPYRGTRNEPAYVVEVAKCVAAEKGMTLQEVDRITTENTVRFSGWYEWCARRDLPGSACGLRRGLR